MIRVVKHCDDPTTLGYNLQSSKCGLSAALSQPPGEFWVFLGKGRRAYLPRSLRKPTLQNVLQISRKFASFLPLRRRRLTQRGR